MRRESHHFELNDPMIRAVTIDIYDDYATITYFLNLPYLKPAVEDRVVFTASYGENFLSIDLENRDAKIVAKITHDQAALAIQDYSKIAYIHTISTSYT